MENVMKQFILFSNPGFFAGSYVDAAGNVAKCLIASSPAFYLADQEGSQYGQFASMKELVQVSAHASCDDDFRPSGIFLRLRTKTLRIQ